jgi:hypothetical protein
VGTWKSVRRAVAVEIENPPPELSAIEEPYRRIVEEVAAYVAERGRLEKEKRRLDLTQDAEGRRQTARGAGPGHPHDPRQRGR